MHEVLICWITGRTAPTWEWTAYFTLQAPLVVFERWVGLTIPGYKTNAFLKRTLLYPQWYRVSVGAARGVSECDGASIRNSTETTPCVTNQKDAPSTHSFPLSLFHSFPLSLFPSFHSITLPLLV